MNLACALELPLSFLGENFIASHYWCESKLSPGTSQSFLGEPPKTQCCNKSHSYKAFSCLLKTGGLVCFVVFVNLRKKDYKYLAHYMPKSKQKDESLFARLSS